jgi:hypothetical protein
VLVRSIADVEANFGPRAGGDIPLWDYLDVYFREGGRRAYVGRYTAGAGAAAAALLALFPKDLGPGQIVLPSETPGAATYTVQLDHAEATNRVALMDVASTDDTPVELDAKGDALMAISAEDESYGGLFGPWVEVPAPAGVIGGSLRTVHATAAVAGLIARSDALGNPNRAAAGRDFPLQFVTGFAGVDINMTDRIALLNSGVNTFATRYNVLQLYGFQTGIVQSDVTPFWQLNATRARMWLRSRAEFAGEAYMFKPLDGRGRLASALKTDLDAICLELYQADGLYGETPEDAFATEVGESVNTDLTVAAGELHATVEARLSLHAKRVLIDLVAVPVTGAVSSAQ